MIYRCFRICSFSRQAGYKIDRIAEANDADMEELGENVIMELLDDSDNEKVDEPVHAPLGAEPDERDHMLLQGARLKNADVENQEATEKELKETKTGVVVGETTPIVPKPKSKPKDKNNVGKGGMVTRINNE